MTVAFNCPLPFMPFLRALRGEKAYRALGTPALAYRAAEQRRHLLVVKNAKHKGRRVRENKNSKQ